MDQRWVNPTSHAFGEAGRKLQMPVSEDFNGKKQEGVGLYQVTQKAGERWSAARAYVEPARERSNLDIKTKSLVEKLIVKDGRVTGVQIKRAFGRETLSARSAVVLSAGAFGSPQIRHLSGIGPADHLKEMGIEVVLDKPEVGSNLEDHIDYVGSWTTESKDPIGDSMEGNIKMAKAVIEHRLKRTGIMTTPFAESGGFWRSTPDAPASDIQFHFVPAQLENHGRDKTNGHGFSIHACVFRPESKGTVRLNSANAADAPKIDNNFLDDDRDIAVLRAGVRQIHRMVATAPLSDYQPQDRFDTNLDDDAALDKLIRDRADTVYHPVGTCRMGSDDDAVVDERLRFKGLDGLYIADASIMPKIVSGKTNAPSIMIGERCADFIKADLALN